MPVSFLHGIGRYAGFLAFSILALSAMTVSARADITSNLAAYYKMDEASGTSASDSSGNGNTGTLANGAAFTSSGKYNNAVLLDGTNDKITVAHSASLSTTSFTISAWVYLNSASGFQFIVDKGVAGDASSGNYYFYFPDDTTQMVCGFSDAATAARFWVPEGRTLNTWIHYTCTFDNTTKAVVVYKNGEVLASGTLNYTPTTNTGVLGIGWNAPENGLYFNGKLDDVRIYTRALSNADVVELYSGITSSTYCTKPLGSAGDILFNSSMGRIMQSCDGTNWKAWPRSIGSGSGGTWRDIRPIIDISCGIKTDNTAYCWGRNGSGELGNGSTSNSYYPVAVSGGWSWIVVDAGQNPGGVPTTCGIRVGGTMYCWGDNTYGMGANSTLSSISTPRAITAGGTWKSLSMGGDWGCAIKSDDTAWCWGNATQNKWGDGTAGGGWAYTPGAVAGGKKWKTISAGSSSGNGYNCGIASDDTGWCWGDNDYGQLGDGTSGTDRNAPRAISTTGVQTWKQISAGSITTCGIKTDGTGWCWGGNAGTGAIGNGVSTSATTIYTTPQALSVTGVTTWKNIWGRGDNFCGVKTDGTGWCWGYGQEGNLGDGAVVNYSSPHEVMSGAKWKMIYPNWPTLGIMENGTLWAWGENPTGSQGIGITTQTNTPNYVVGSTATACSSPTGVAGDLLFNSASRVLQWCDGRQWNPAGPISPTGPLAGCTGPTGVAGDLLFNSASATHQYCDGDTWRGITW